MFRKRTWIISKIALRGISKGDSGSKFCLNFAEKRGYLKGYDEGVEEGREAGRQEGREEGRALGISDAVNKMETAGMSVDQIALILELDAEEIRKML